MVTGVSPTIARTRRSNSFERLVLHRAGRVGEAPRQRDHDAAGCIGDSKCPGSGHRCGAHRIQQRDALGQRGKSGRTHEIGVAGRPRRKRVALVQKAANGDALGHDRAPDEQIVVASYSSNFSARALYVLMRRCPASRWPSFHQRHEPCYADNRMSDIVAWLESWGLGQLASRLAEQDIALHALRHLTEDDLKELGLTIGLRRRLMHAIEEGLRRPAAEAVSPAPAADKPATNANQGAERR